MSRYVTLFFKNNLKQSHVAATTIPETKSFGTPRPLRFLVLHHKLYAVPVPVDVFCIPLWSLRPTAPVHDARRGLYSSF